jgi:hypothetical protein
MTTGQPDAALPEPDADDFRDLMEAAESALGFWDNPMDDADWRVE